MSSIIAIMTLINLSIGTYQYQDENNVKDMNNFKIEVIGDEISSSISNKRMSYIEDYDSDLEFIDAYTVSELNNIIPEDSHGDSIAEMIRETDTVDECLNLINMFKLNNDHYNLAKDECLNNGKEMSL